MCLLTVCKIIFSPKVQHEKAWAALLFEMLTLKSWGFETAFLYGYSMGRREVRRHTRTVMNSSQSPNGTWEYKNPPCWIRPKTYLVQLPVSPSGPPDPSGSTQDNKIPASWYHSFASGMQLFHLMLAYLVIQVIILLFRYYIAFVTFITDSLL